MNVFDKSYYESNNYTDYLGRGDRYLRLEEDLFDILKKFNMDQGPRLDFGCAVGFLLEGLNRREGHSYGSDISEYALEECRKKGLYTQKTPDWSLLHSTVFALDVLEHISESELNTFFDKIRTKCIIFRIPVCAKGEDDYVLEVSRNDPSHIIRWNKSQWQERFRSAGYLPLDLNLSTIYCSEGVYSGIALSLDE